MILPLDTTDDMRMITADEGFAEAAEAVSRGLIDQTTYQRAADRLQRVIDAAREYLDR